ncbi:MAG TPA: M28 family peptidase [Gemmatimonadaceae bacterium]|nr:M28 family peptidase [Gemmatimonadaceae bacterium]
MRRSAVLLLVVAAGCTSPPRTEAAPAPAPNAVPSMAADLRRDLFAFSDDSMLGRSAETPNAARAARFIAARLKEAGIKPAGDSGGYLQRVPLSRTFVRAARFTVTSPTGRTSLPFGSHLLPVPSLGEGLPLPVLEAAGDLVFAGYGLTAPGFGRNDLTGLSLADKVVVFVNDAPPGLDSAHRMALRDPRSLGDRLGAIIERRPAAIIVLFTGRQAGELPALAAGLTDSSLRLQPTLDGQRVLPMVLFGNVKNAAALLPAGWPHDDHARVLDGRSFSAKVDLVQDVVEGYNVVAEIPGSDSALSHSYVALGAHLDHIGIQRPDHGDSIANGADDDGSGTVSLIEIAKREQVAPRMKRSMLFVWHTGEELGLFGSEWFTSHPTVPLDSIVAQLNVDMIGRNDPDSLYLIGPISAPNGQSRVLGAIVDSVNSASPHPFLINRDWDAPSHPEQLYYRSDHYNYAKHGIPIVFFTTGLHADYHKVTDSADKIDYDKLSRVAALIMHIGDVVANSPTRPLPPALLR